MKHSTQELFALGRAYLKKKAPYLATTLYGLTPVAVKGCGTMAVTEGMVLYYDPDWVENEPTFQATDGNGRFIGYVCVAACIHHECQHIVRGLHRMAALDNAELANIAADMAINCTLRDAGWLLPPWVVYPETYEMPPNKTLEWYYHQLKKLAKKGGDGKGPKGTGPLAGKCGGAAGNPVDEELEKKLDAEAGRGKIDVERIRKTTAKHIQDHLKTHGRGSAPGFTTEELKFEPKKSVIDWRGKLGRIIRRTVGSIVPGATDFSMRRPSKRSMVLGVVRPGLVDQTPEIMFIRDTSGSMGREQLNAANNEAINVMIQMGVDEVWFMDADTKAHQCKRVRLRDIPKIGAMGRGGTSFIEPLQKAAKLRPKPDVVIYLTDGDGSAPKVKPPYFEVVWCIVPTSYGRRPAKWGHIVVCSNDQKLHQAYDYAA